MMSSCSLCRNEDDINMRFVEGINTNMRPNLNQRRRDETSSPA